MPGQNAVSLLSGSHGERPGRIVANHPAGSIMPGAEHPGQIAAEAVSNQRQLLAQPLQDQFSPGSPGCKKIQQCAVLVE
ncbi:hypothetical protein D3C74_428630 [compost metagenome]